MLKSLPKPDLIAYTNIASCPKQIMALLKRGCEIKQIGQDQKFSTDPAPQYFLIAPALAWEVELQAKHVRALETLGLIEVECSCNYYWISKQSFSLPDLSNIPTSHAEAPNEARM